MEKKMKMILDPLWVELERDAQRISGNGILKRMLAPDAVCSMFLGVKHPSLNRVFMLQVVRNLLPSREQIPESKGFEVALQITGEEPETHATFVLSVMDDLYNEVFSAMVENLYQSLTACSEEQQIMEVFLKRLREWQQFFEKNRQEGLSAEVQRGLYGELYFLQNHLLSIPEHYMSEISTWTGSRNRQHDFQSGETAVEVKTSIAKQHQKLLISSEQQLDEMLTGNLFIFHLSLSMMENHPDTLPALVGRLRETLGITWEAAMIFEEALLERGYFNTQVWRYEQTGYVIRESNAFHVTGDFPRLTERDLPLGVGDLTYSISVAECKKFIIPVEKVISHIRGNKL